MAAFDLIVAGAGIVGAACAREAANAGLRVAIVERGAIGGGATGAGMGHLVALDDDPAELALSRYSLALWEELAALPEAEFSRCGTLWLAETEEEFATVASKAARLNACGRPADVIDAALLYRLEPALAPGLHGGLRVASDAIVYPPRVAKWLVDQARATVFQGRRVSALCRDGMRLDDGSHLSGPVLVACGTESSALLPELVVRPRKGHLVITDRYPALVHHQLVELGYAASAHGHDDSSVAFNLQPRATGQLLLGSSREYGVTDASVSPSMLARMIERAFRFVPALRALKAIRAWTGFRPATPDGLPYIGKVRDGIFVAAGHEGLGATTALGTARLLIDILLERTPAIDPRPYSPSRACA